MYENKVPEKLIMEWSGHLSVHGLLSYERTTLAQKNAVCDTLLGMPMQESGSTTVKSKKGSSESVDDKTTSDDDESTAPVKEVSEGTDELPDVMCHMQFSIMTGCTFNFSLRWHWYGCWFW